VAVTVGLATPPVPPTSHLLDLNIETTPVVVVIEMREDLTLTVETGALGDTAQIGTATSTDLTCPLKTRYS